MATRLARLKYWTEWSGVDLDTATVDFHAYCGEAGKNKIIAMKLIPEEAGKSISWWQVHVCFHHAQETEESFRQVKKSIGGHFEKTSEGDVTLRAPLRFLPIIDEEDSPVILSVVWVGGFTCETTRKCKWNGFLKKDEPEKNQEAPAG